MKRCSQTVVIAVLILLFSSLHANSKKQFSMETKDKSEMLIKFTTPEVTFTDIERDGELYQQVKAKNAGALLDVAKPDLPTFSTYVKIPNTGNVQVHYNIANRTMIQNINVYPYQNQFNASKSDPFTKDFEVYNSDNAFPNSIVKVSEPMIMRDHRVVLLTICPFIYAPKTQELVQIQSLDITLAQENSRSKNEIVQTKQSSFHMNSFYNASILNIEKQNDRDPNMNYEDRMILMIRKENNNEDEEFVEKLNDFVAWKKQKGFLVTSVTTAETGTTSSSIQDYIQNAYETWENRPEFVILLGDAGSSSDTYYVPTFFENLSNYNGAGDFPYSLIAGDDDIPDLFVGRISFDTVIEFKTIINKIMKFEKGTILYNYSWMNDVLLAGATDHGTGISAWITNRYIRELYENNYPETEFNVMEESATSPTAVNNALNMGKLFYNYRGWLGMDGWGDNEINQLANDDMPFNAVILTCGTGTFAGSYGEARTELLVRHGTVGTPKGALTAIGLSTSGTHTAFNNCIVGGMWSGLLTENMITMGEVLAFGQSYLFETYGNSNPNQAYIFSHWAALMGDPSMYVYKKPPMAMSVEYDTILNTTDNHLELSVTDNSGNPISGAWVTITNDTFTFQKSQYTGENGIANIVFESPVAGQLSVVVTKPEHLTFMGSAEFSAFSYLSFTGATIDDDDEGESNGNNDQVINPGETFEYTANIMNNTGATLENVDFVLAVNETYFSIENNTATIETLANGNGAEVGPFTITANGTLPDQFIAEFALETVVQTEEISLYWRENVQAPNLKITAIETLDSVNNIIDPNETVNFVFTVENQGSFDVADLQGELVSLNDALIVDENIADFGTINQGENATNMYGSLTVNTMAILIPGMQLNLELHLTNEYGFQQIEQFMVEVGNPTVTDPTGPDQYGYFIYDEDDTSYELCPTYEWIEIEDLGVTVPLSDGGNNQDDSEVVALPFAFQFYGESYDEITVCSNGWISFGESTQATFRNFRLPGALGPSPMVAVFWDDFYLQGSDVLTYHDDANGAFIVQWNNVKSYYDDSNQTFQAILYDVNQHPSSTGDGLIKLQYKEIHNTDVGSGSTHGNYASIGLENQDETIGLEYTFNNEYPATAQVMGNEKALLIAPQPIVHENAYLNIGNVFTFYEYDEQLILVPENTLQAGMDYLVGVEIANAGLQTATNVNAIISSSDVNVTVNMNQSDYPNISNEMPESNLQFFEISISENCPGDYNIPFELLINAENDTWTRTFNLLVKEAELSFINYAIFDGEGNQNSVIDPNEEVKFILNLENQSKIPATNVMASLSVDNENISITNDQIENVTILPMSKTQFVFNVSANASLSVGDVASFTLTYAADTIASQQQTLTTVVGVQNLAANFDSDNNGYSGNWVWGELEDNEPHSAPNVWATSLSGDYGQNANQSLTSEEYYIGANGTLKFWQWYFFESGYDGGNVKISIDNGNTWELINPIGNYNDTYVSALGEAGWTGSNTEWTQVEFDLSDYADHYVYFKWTFKSDYMVNERGWFIDDVELEGAAVEIGGITGTVTIPNELRDIETVAVMSNNTIVYPNEAGEYSLYLSAGSYDVYASKIGAEALSTPDVVVQNSEMTDNVDFVLHLLAHPENLIAEYDEETEEVSLSWDYTQGDSPSMTTYQIYRQKGSSSFIMLDETTDTNYIDVPTVSATYRYRIVAVYENGVSIPSNIDDVMVNIVAENQVPQYITRMEGNYPNPFNPKTDIRFSLKNKAHVDLKVYNVRGQLVRTLKKEVMNSGSHIIRWNGDNNQGTQVATGVYFIRLKTDNYEKSIKALLLK